MSFTDNIKPITPSLSQLKTGTPAIKVGGKVLVGGIGGNFIPDGFANVAAGYVTVSDSVVTLHDLTNNTTKVIDKLYMTDTGVDEPQYQGGGSSMNFYKCASVDSDSGWTGRLATIDDTTGVWSFSSDSTEGLTYGKLPIPVVGGIYAGENCICRISEYNVGIPQEGIVFYAPFNSVENAASTGQTFSYIGNPVSEVVNGIQSVRFDNTTYLNTKIISSINDSTIIGTELTFSLWIKASASDGIWTTYNPLDFPNYYNAERLSTDSNKTLGIQNYGTIDGAQLTDIMTHVALVFSSGVVYAYINGQLAGQQSGGDGIRSGWSIHSTTSNAAYNSTMHMAALRVYNRALSATEISLLASQFTPTNS